MPQVDTSTLAEDRACIHCGYNLRGLSQEGQCPECNTGIANSLRENLLVYADPRWLDTVRLGCTLRLWTFAALVLSALAFARFFQTLILFGPFAIGTWASFAITTIEPRIESSEPSITLRKTIRICAIVLLAAIVIEPVVAGTIDTTGLSKAFGFACIGLIWGEVAHLRRLALRSSNHDNANRAWNVLRGATVVLVGSFVISMILQFCGWGPINGPSVPIGSSSQTIVEQVLRMSHGILSLYCLVIFFRYVSLLFRLRATLKVAADRSRELTV